MRVVSSTLEGCVVELFGGERLSFDFRLPVADAADVGVSAEEKGEDDMEAITTTSGETVDLDPLFSGASWGAVIWDASLVMCLFLEGLPLQRVAGKRVVELGACCGLPGLVCALRGAKQTVLTDLPAYLPAAAAAIANNADVLRQAGVADQATQASLLEWGKPGTGNFLEHFGQADLVLAADCVSTDVYGRASWEALVGTLRAVCACDGEVVIVSARRPNDGLDEFVELAATAFEEHEQLPLRVPPALAENMVQGSAHAEYQVHIYRLPLP